MEERRALLIDDRCPTSLSDCKVDVAVSPEPCRCDALGPVIAGGGSVVELCQHFSKVVEVRLGQVSEIDANCILDMLEYCDKGVIDVERGLGIIVSVSTRHISRLELMRRSLILRWLLFCES
jgi:hypothetical protein